MAYPAPHSEIKRGKTKDPYGHPAPGDHLPVLCPTNRPSSASVRTGIVHDRGYEPQITLFSLNNQFAYAE
jgi:hypothetical protein